MKKIYISLLALVMSFGFATNSNAQGLERGNMVIDAFYGGPNLFKTFMKTSYTYTTSTNIKAGGIGPVGARFEYLMSEKIGVGGEVHYAGAFVSYDDTYLGTQYSYKVSVPRLRIMASLHYYLVNSDNFNLYWMLRAGYGSFSVKYDGGDPTFGGSSFSVSTPVPIAFRTGFGFRVFFTENIGIHTEIGFAGGGLLQGGLSIKL